MIDHGLCLLGAFLLGAAVGVYCCGRAWKRNYDALELRNLALARELDVSAMRVDRHVDAHMRRSQFKLLRGRERGGAA